MSDRFYDIVVFIGRFPFWVSSRVTLLHLDRAARDGAYILACSHTSPYDIPVLMRSSPKRLDFVSIAEVFAKPFVGWFFGNMNAFALDRGRRDSATVRIILDRLARGRSVVMFPEGHIRKPEQSVVRGAPFRGGVARIARLAGAPILPVVAWGTPAYSRFTAWLPHRRTR